VTGGSLVDCSALHDGPQHTIKQPDCRTSNCPLKRNVQANESPRVTWRGGGCNNASNRCGMPTRNRKKSSDRADRQYRELTWFFHNVRGRGPHSLTLALRHLQTDDCIMSQSSANSSHSTAPDLIFQDGVVLAPGPRVQLPEVQDVPVQRRLTHRSRGPVRQSVFGTRQE
jgi:hypothetical protein